MSEYLEINEHVDEMIDQQNTDQRLHDRTLQIFTELENQIDILKEEVETLKEEDESPRSYDLYDGGMVVVIDDLWVHPGVFSNGKISTLKNEYWNFCSTEPFKRLFPKCHFSDQHSDVFAYTLCISFEKVDEEDWHHIGFCNENFYDQDQITFIFQVEVEEYDHPCSISVDIGIGRSARHIHEVIIPYDAKILFSNRKEAWVMMEMYHYDSSTKEFRLCREDDEE